MNDGILLVDKPAGMSSFGVVARVRRKLSEEAGFFEIKEKDGTWRKKWEKVKVGHTGTLDPFATGLLILLVGKETKRANEFLKLDKEYVATLRLGMVSTTGDIEGDLSSFSDTVNNPSFRDAAFSQPAVAGESHLFLGRSLRNGLSIKRVHLSKKQYLLVNIRNLIGELGVDAIGPVNIFTLSSKVTGMQRIFVVRTDTNDFFDTVIMGILQEIRLLLGRKPLKVVEVTMGINQHITIISRKTSGTCA